MIISYLAVRTISLPFKGLEDIENTNYKIILQSGTSFVDMFRYSEDEKMQALWKERMEPARAFFSTVIMKAKCLHVRAFPFRRRRSWARTS